MPAIRQMKIENLATHPEPYVTAKELAEYFHVSDTTIYKFADNGALEGTRIGRRRSFTRESAHRLELDGAREGERMNGQATD